VRSLQALISPPVKTYTFAQLCASLGWYDRLGKFGGMFINEAPEGNYAAPIVFCGVWLDNLPVWV